MPRTNLGTLVATLTLISATAHTASAAGVPNATEGSQFAYLSTGPGSLFGNGSTELDLSGDGQLEADPAGFSYVFDELAGVELSFDWNLLTAEVTGGVPDFFTVEFNGTVILSSAIAFANGDLPIIPNESFDSLNDGLTLLGPDGSTFVDGQTGWSTFTFLTTFEGVQTLRFTIFDDNDAIVDSALLIDAIRRSGEVVIGFEDVATSSPLSDVAELSDVVGTALIASSSGFSEESVLVPVPVPAGLPLFIGALGISLPWARKHRRSG